MMGQNMKIHVMYIQNLVAKYIAMGMVVVTVLSKKCLRRGTDGDGLEVEDCLKVLAFPHS